MVSRTKSGTNGSVRLDMSAELTRLPRMNERSVALETAIAAVRTAAALCERVRRDLVAEPIQKDDRSPVTIADFGAQAIVCRMVADAFPEDPIVGEEGSAALRDPARRHALDTVTALVGEHLRGGASRGNGREEISAEDVLSWIDLGAGQPARRFWTLDPIDGTRGFLRGDHYAVALALIEDGEVKVSALACPALDIESLGAREIGVINRNRDVDAIDRDREVGAIDRDRDVGATGGDREIGAIDWDRDVGAVGAPGASGALVVAHRGGGAWAAPLFDERPDREWRRLTVCQPADHGCRRFVESVEAKHANHALQGAVARSAGIEAPPLRMDSQAKYAALAGGLASLYLRLPRPGITGYREKIWDHAPGALIVQEAGGRVTDMFGRPLAFDAARLATGAGVVATNGALHQAVLEAIRG